MASANCHDKTSAVRSDNVNWWWLACHWTDQRTYQKSIHRELITCQLRVNANRVFDFLAIQASAVLLVPVPTLSILWRKCPPKLLHITIQSCWPENTYVRFVECIVCRTSQPTIFSDCLIRHVVTVTRCIYRCLQTFCRISLQDQGVDSYSQLVSHIVVSLWVVCQTPNCIDDIYIEKTEPSC